MISAVAFNVGLVLVIIVPLVLYLLSNTDYVFDVYCATDDDGIWELIIDTIITLIYVSSIAGFIFAGVMFCDEIFSATFALFTNVAMASLIDFHMSMITLSISCGIVLIELLLALPLLIGAFVWHQLHKSGADRSRRQSNDIS